MSVVYVLTTHILEDGNDDPTVEQVRKRAKWDMMTMLAEDSFEAKYMADDASSKKFLVFNFTNYKMTDSRPVMEQHNELLGILGRFIKHNINIEETIQVSCIIKKLPLFWKDFKHTLKHKKEELTLVGLDSHLRIEESLMELVYSYLCDLNDIPSLENKKYFVIFIDDASRVPNKKNKIIPYELWTKRKPNLNYLRVWGCRAVVRLPDPKLKTLGERGIECIFVGYADHSKAFRFYVIEPNDSVSINFIIESRDVIFDENIFSSVPRPSLKIPNGTKDISGPVVPKEITEEVIQQPELEFRKSKRNRTPNDFGPEFQLYLIEGTRDEVCDQHSYCFNVEDDPKTFDEAMKSQDVAFWKEVINDEMDSIIGNNTWVLADLPPGIYYFDTYAPVARISTIRLPIAMASIHNLIIHQMDVKTSFLNGDLDEEEFLSSKFSMKDTGEADVILVIRIKHESNRIAISQSHYIKKVLKYLKKIMDYKLIYGGYPLVLEGYTDASWISNTEDNSSTSGWVVLLGGAAGKEAEWLKNLLLEIPLWYKPKAPIFIRCDSAATLAKAYSQMYNGKSRHLCVRHSMIREFITN
nr:zinc finger, CCHC-type [Tanacetum cinerariifolium]